MRLLIITILLSTQVAQAQIFIDYDFTVASSSLNLNTSGGDELSTNYSLSVWNGNGTLCPSDCILEWGYHTRYFLKPSGSTNLIPLKYISAPGNTSYPEIYTSLFEGYNLFEHWKANWGPPTGSQTVTVNRTLRIPSCVVTDNYDVVARINSDTMSNGNSGIYWGTINQLPTEFKYEGNTEYAFFADVCSFGQGCSLGASSSPSRDITIGTVSVTEVTGSTAYSMPSNLSISCPSMIIEGIPVTYYAQLENNPDNVAITYEWSTNNLDWVSSGNDNSKSFVSSSSPLTVFVRASTICNIQLTASTTCDVIGCEVLCKDEDWLNIPNGQAPDIISDEIYTDGRVGINTQNLEAILHVKFPYACGQYHNGNYNALFDARDGAWDNVVSLTGWDPISAAGGDAIGCSNTGSNAAFSVRIMDQSTGMITENARIQANGNGIFNGVWIGSDKNYKSNIEEFRNPIDIVNSLQGKRYDFKFAETAKGIPSIGFIAQDVKKVLPELVRTRENGNLAVNYDGFIPILTEAIKAQQVSLEEKSLEISELENQLERMGNMLAELRTEVSMICSNDCEKTYGELVNQENDEQLANARLGNNIPNPANGFTSIGFYIPQTVTDAYLSINDLSGRLIKKVNLLSFGVESKVELNLEEVSSGIYIYSLIIENNIIDSKKMIVN